MNNICHCHIIFIESGFVSKRRGLDANLRVEIFIDTRVTEGHTCAEFHFKQCVNSERIHW